MSQYSEIIEKQYLETKPWFSTTVGFMPNISSDREYGERLKFGLNDGDSHGGK